MLTGIYSDKSKTGLPEVDQLRIGIGNFSKIENFNQLIVHNIKDIEIGIITEECRLLDIDGITHFGSISISGYSNLRKIRVKEDALNSIVKLTISHNENLKSISIRNKSCYNVKQLVITGSYSDYVTFDLPRLTTIKVGDEALYYADNTLESLIIFLNSLDLPQFTTFKTRHNAFHYSNSLSLIGLDYWILII